MDLKQFSEKMISSLRGRLHKSINTVVASYVSSPYFMLSSPLCTCAKWNKNMETLNLVREYNSRAIIYSQLDLYFNTQCIYVYFIAFYGQSVILKYNSCVLYLVKAFSDC